MSRYTVCHTQSVTHSHSHTACHEPCLELGSGLRQGRDLDLVKLLPALLGRAGAERRRLARLPGDDAVDACEEAPRLAGRCARAAPQRLERFPDRGRGGSAGAATGIAFAPSDPLALHGAIARAVQLHGNRPIWQAMQRAAMRANVSWDSSAARYAALYRDLLAEAA